MSFDSRLIHTVAIERSTDGATDDWNQPTQAFATLATVAARITTKRGRELAQLNDAGPVKGEYLIFMRPTDVTEGDHLVSATSEIYEIEFVAERSGRSLHHLELDATRVWP